MKPIHPVTRWLIALIALAIVAVIALIASPPPPSLSPRPLNLPSANQRGIHLLLDDGRNSWPVTRWPDHLRAARAIVGEWGYVTQVIRLDDLDVGKWQRFMELCAEFRLTPILRLATTFARHDNFWIAPPTDLWGGYATIARRYADFAVTLQWPTQDHYLIIGNEPNHGNEWGGAPDPAAYARFLIDVADQLHEADPSARVLNAGFDAYSPHTNGLPMPDGFAYMDEETFLDRMFAAQPGVFLRLDAWASHPYPPGPFTAPPWEQSYGVDYLNGAFNPQHIEPPSGIVNRGINGYEWELWKLSTYGVPALPVMITETGWRHAESVELSLDNAPQPVPNAETMAIYFDLALRGNNGRYPDLPKAGWTPWLADPRVVAITPFALNGSPTEWGHTNWLTLDPQGHILGQYPFADTMLSP